MTDTLAAPPPKTKSQALRSYDVADFPALTGLEEEWRFTPLKRLRGLTGEVVGGPAPAIGYDELPAGVTVSTVDKSDPRVGSVLTPFDRVSALAWSRATTASLVSVAAETVLDAPAVLRVAGAGAVGFGHTFVEVGRFAEATIVLEQTGSVTLADNVEVAVADGAKLTLVTVADWAADAVQAQHVRIRLGRDARVTHIQVTLGGDLVRQFTSVEYTGRGGEAELYGLYFADAGQHLEHRQLVDHSVPDCRSYVGYRGALQGEGAHTVWVGDVLIQVQATGTDTYEINRNLVLTDGARADSVPNLEIETGEVAGAGHASATGRFDDEQLFYLMARGIPEGEARKLVVRGFFAELVNKIPVEELRERLGASIEDRLAKAGA
ncbi:Fe-S cluster assembly protein SufD [Phytohabitans suffuscus]|uniref:Fe-S cluster assembly protein SufD n=1 Tax=Phytohabitans suffuscus TaxID=624315 RepID=A0A6F8YBF7_9ACTN|nr:Fe-S cluster assembly protein SufD [Phytohabitans suffuscus]BCB83426.1 Fe-S cluster assembly protein SufD [Phytohabitans suffuscus]